MHLSLSSKISSLILLIVSTVFCWQLIWSDEFNYTGLPDPDKWGYEVGYIRNNELQYYTSNRAENAYVDSGCLKITARRDNWNGHEYTAASINTRATGNWTYGRIEVRAKIPGGRGMWPAIWMLGSDIGTVGWPTCGEIDIMENVGYQPNKIFGTVHSKDSSGGNGRGGNIMIPTAYDSFHVYAINWYDDKIEFYVDSTKYFTVNKGDPDNWPYIKPFYLIINSAIGGAWGGVQGVDTTIFPTRYYVDYVRVYQEDQAGPFTLSTSNSRGGSVIVDPIAGFYTSGTEITLKAMAGESFEFKGWTGDISSKANPYTFKIYRNTSVKALFARPGEMVLDGGFDNGLAEWSQYSASGTAATRTVTNGTFEINISNAGTNIWDLQLSQPSMNMVAGHNYRFSFKAWAQTPRTISARVNMTVDPFSAWFAKDTTLGTSSQSYTFEFTMREPGDANARVEFDFGGSTVTTYIDDVSLIDITPFTGINGAPLNKNYKNSRANPVTKKAILINDTKPVHSGSLYNLTGKKIDKVTKVRNNSTISKGVYIIPEVMNDTK